MCVLYFLCRICVMYDCIFFFFKQKTAYEMRISDWSSDVCSSDLVHTPSVTRPSSTVKPGCSVELPHASGSSMPRSRWSSLNRDQIGRASCRERACQYV